MPICCVRRNGSVRSGRTDAPPVLKLIWCWLQAIDGLDADVLTIENSRSGDEMVQALAKYGYKRDIGPGGRALSCGRA